MLWPSTVIGAGAGFAIASIPGALLGALLGQALDRRLALHSWAHLRQRLGGRAVPRDDELLFILLGRLAKNDGRVVDGHIQQAREEMRRMDLSEPAQQRAILAFNRGKKGRDRLHSYLRRLKTQPHAAEGLLRACWRMAWADGKVSREERELIVLWGKWLGWTAIKVQALASEYDPLKKPLAVSVDAYQEALRLLGVEADAEPAQIKHAYRRLLSRHHPDKAAGNGADVVQVREATDRTQELHQAYTLIRERRDFR
ncbi:TerB family tellurite resistance protein [Pseudomonas sp. CCI3.2]|uniref:TerB family tellurite resistance protein n=1 Tax=unclassified Pseudomonas TaxID=196821 RepID=UPI002AC8B09D|nr:MULTISPECIES: TerB family tellurite resistance protein [unclassified Pseudomonas]MEB0079792.1 TerB family tellurite resistance protein [Pseudomonas sp. MH10out]MEB0091983.1 TerB family tellurite resistance protein [Pseudomonas sp. CCI4.2]MEB0103145.1 TerB family tellurite resistance protein [Pseudomonas sp. CCI3.2]MEB0122270.1 TerB family tellurite resistance protein [Pseudomonas sp. CCI1.2]MEB0132674.1 TerB family tellurite resistance protein [Pseudomonas sp. CCI2.4]